MGRQITTVATGFHFLEGPRWRDDRIWFSDFYGHRVYSCLEDGGDLRIEAQVPQQPSGTGRLPDGRTLIVSMRDRLLLRREGDGSLVSHADLSGHARGHLNDMVVDDRGRAFVGEFGFDLMGGAPPEPGRLMRADPDGTVTTVADDLRFPNGMVITPEGTLLVGESFGNRITAFDIGADGALINRRVWAQFGPVPTGDDILEALGQIAVAPDGACLDADGAMWVADAAHARVVRVREGGEIVDEIGLDTGVFACMLGGADGRTLFLCAAPDFLEHNRVQAKEGSLLSVRVDSPRAGLP